MKLMLAVVTQLLLRARELTVLRLVRPSGQVLAGLSSWVGLADYFFLSFLFM